MDSNTAATRSVPAGGLCPKQFPKDHYFPFQGVLQRSRILLRPFPSGGASGPPARCPIENELGRNDA